jgi:hypothetical protein
MRELNECEIENVNGGIKFHFNVIWTAFTVIGATIIGGPVAGAAVIATAIATQGTGNLVDMYHDEFGNPR